MSVYAININSTSYIRKNEINMYTLRAHPILTLLQDLHNMMTSNHLFNSRFIM